MKSSAGMASTLLLAGFIAACARPATGPADLSAVAPSAGARADAADLEAGKAAWTGSCASCHFVPDASLDFDRLWLEMIRTTS